MLWRVGIDRWSGGLPQVDLDVRRTALLIIDMQRVCAHRDYGQGLIMKKKWPEFYNYYFPRLEQVVIPNQVRLLEFFRANKLRVVHVVVGPFLADGSDMFLRRRLRDAERMAEVGSKEYFHAGTPEFQILDEVAPLPGELVVQKNSSGAFNSTAIDQYLRNMDINSLVICGVATNVCVDTTARDAADRGYNCVLVEDACASFDEEAHIATVRNFGRVFGKVQTTDEVIADLRQKLEALAAPQTV